MDEDDITDDEVTDPEIDGDAVTFLIGEHQQQFRVPIERTLSNAYIVEDTIHSDEVGAVVTGARWNRLNPAAFRPVYEFLKYGDWRPRLRFGRFPGLSRKPEVRAREAYRCIVVWNMARELQIEELMEVALEKLGRLGTHPFAMVMGVPLVFGVESDGTEQDITMRNFMIQHAVDNFTTYQITAAEKFWALQEKFPEFVGEVVDKFAVKLKQQTEMNAERED